MDFSSSLSRVAGVPQGSCLGPILFTLFSATMGSDLQHSRLYSYADDAQLCVSYEAGRADSAVSILNADLSIVHDWSERHGIKLNKEKCSVLSIPSNVGSETVGEVLLGSVRLKECESSRLLGLMLDSGLTLSGHVSAVCRRTLGRLRMLYKHRHMFPRETRLRLVQALVLSVIDYCLPVYGNIVSKGDLEKLQRVQNMCVRYVCGLRRFDHVSEARRSLGLLTVADTCTLRSSCLVYRILITGRPGYLREKLKSRSQVRSRSTRQDQVLEMPRVRREFERKRFAYFAPKLYNELSSSVTGQGVSFLDSQHRLTILVLAQ
uniref:Reverse transcriptase domain-containing protein n=1 Tax=Homalodisca liturata TaxID=320908 RepID=A0A1B6JLP3_9HEMI